MTPMSRKLNVLAMTLSVTFAACGCDDANPSLHLIPWGDGSDFDLSVEVGDSLPFLAEVEGRAKGYVVFGDRCSLYNSHSSPERFDIELSDSSP